MKSNFIINSIGTGLVMAADGSFSNQSDVVLFDPLSNAPLFPKNPIPIWLLEATFGVIEVKTNLSPTAIADAVAKCRRFKSLPTHFADGLGRRQLDSHLFILWAFEAPSNVTAKTNITAALHDIPEELQPDFIVVPGRFIVTAGEYRRLSLHGQPGSLVHTQGMARAGGNHLHSRPIPLQMLDLGPNTLAAFLIWVNSWIYAAGPRRPDLVPYYPNKWGTSV